jgi:AraC family transcriptional regulator of arabinose operon
MINRYTVGDCFEYEYKPVTEVNMNEVLLYGDRLSLIHNIGEFKTPTADWVHPDRVMDVHLFIYVTHGNLVIWEGNTEFRLENGDALFLKRGIRHFGIESPSLDSNWFYIHFNIDAPSFDEQRKYESFSMLHSVNSFFSTSLYRTAIKLPKYIRLSNNNYVERKLKELKDLFGSSNGVRHLLLSIQLMELFLYCYQMSETQKKYTKADITVNKIIEYLENNSDHKISRNEIAVEIQLNYNYLCDVFKQKTGLSIIEFHTRLRINKATEMLKKTSLNISEIGEILGFSNLFYFSRIFKKITGYSPTDYLKNQYST